MNFLENHKLILTPLSPIHIGCGDDYEPTNYIIHEGFLFGFDPARLKLDSREHAELIETSVKPSAASLLSMQSFFFKRLDRCKAIANCKVSVTQNVEDLYKKRVGKVAHTETQGQAVQNNLEIMRTAYNSYTQQAIIPGSSIKGAIRTAVLDFLNQGKNPNIPNNKLEENLLGGRFSTDPFSLIKISDAYGEATRKIIFQVNRKKKDSSEAQTLSLLLESITPGQRSLISEITLQQNDRNIKDIGLVDIAKSCNHFAKREILKELEIACKHNWYPSGWVKMMQDLLASSAFELGEIFLLRTGRHSGAECVTIDGVRSIKIMGKRGDPPQYLNHTKTLWLAADAKEQIRDLLPFGWLLVEVDEINNDISNITLDFFKSLNLEAEQKKSINIPIPPAPIPAPVFVPPSVLKKGVGGLPAIVVVESKPHCLVQLDYEGAPEGKFQCSGSGNLKKDDKLIVEISDVHPKTKLISMVKLTGIRTNA